MGSSIVSGFAATIYGALGGLLAVDDRAWLDPGAGRCVPQARFGEIPERVARLDHHAGRGDVRSGERGFDVWLDGDR